MDMTDYSGPTVAVLIFGEYDDRSIDSVHGDEDEAAAYLGRLILDAHGTRRVGGPWSVEVVPAPELYGAEEPVSSGHLESLEPESTTPDRPDFMVVALREALGATVPEAVDAPWEQLLAIVREQHEALAEREREAREAETLDGNRRRTIATLLGTMPPTTYAPAWTTLYAQIKATREDANRGTSEGDLERLAHHLLGSDEPWHNLNGEVQERYMRKARAAMNAYWGPVA